eukprot:4847940-Amphidinium_carterae.1
MSPGSLSPFSELKWLEPTWLRAPTQNFAPLVGLPAWMSIDLQSVQRSFVTTQSGKWKHGYVYTRLLPSWNNVRQ